MPHSRQIRPDGILALSRLPVYMLLSERARVSVCVCTCVCVCVVCQIPAICISARTRARTDKMTKWYRHGGRGGGGAAETAADEGLRSLARRLLEYVCADADVGSLWLAYLPPAEAKRLPSNSHLCCAHRHRHTHKRTHKRTHARTCRGGGDGALMAMEMAKAGDGGAGAKGELSACVGRANINDLSSQRPHLNTSPTPQNADGRCTTWRRRRRRPRRKRHSGCVCVCAGVRFGAHSPT